MAESTSEKDGAVNGPEKDRSLPGTVEGGPEINQGMKQETKQTGDSRGSYELVEGGKDDTATKEENCCLDCEKCCSCCPEKCCSCCRGFRNFIVTYWKWILGCAALVAVIIILATVLPMVLGKAEQKMTTAPPTQESPVSTSVVTTTLAPTPYPGKVIVGDMLTTENYTVGLDNPSSLAYRTLEKNFTDAMRAFYDTTAFSNIYDGALVILLSNVERQVKINFEVLVQELDDLVVPNARTVLRDHLRTQRKLGKFIVLESSVKST